MRGDCEISDAPAPAPDGSHDEDAPDEDDLGRRGRLTRSVKNLFANVIFVPDFLRATPQHGAGPGYHGWADVCFASLGNAAAMSGFGVVVSTLAIATAQLTGSPVAGTFSLTLEFESRAAISPASNLSQKWGRRPVIVTSALCGVGGSLLVALDLYVRSYALGILGICGVGAANGVSQQLRFVAADAVRGGHKKRALSVCVAGGALAAFVGPSIAIATRLLLQKEYAGCFFAMAGCYLVLAVFAAGARSAGTATVRDDDDDDAEKNEKNASASKKNQDIQESLDMSDVATANTPTLFSLFKNSPNARKGTVCVSCAWTAMFLVMSAAPIAMTGDDEGGYSFDRSTNALRMHLL
jgi:MFS family permease